MLIMVAAMNNSNNQNVDHDTRASPPKDRVSDQWLHIPHIFDVLPGFNKATNL